MERKIIYCPKCGFIGSIEEEKGSPFCPKCETQTIEAGFTKTQWIAMSATEQQKFKKSIKNTAPVETAEAVPAEQEPVAEPAAVEEEETPKCCKDDKMAKDIHCIRNWMTFFGVLTVVSLMLGAIAFLMTLVQ